MLDNWSLYYRVDANDRILGVGGDWDQFALKNDGQGAVADRVIGSSLLSHIAGEAARSHVWTMLDAVRKLERPARRPYRCDGPDLFRFMEMEIKPEKHGGLLVQHRLVMSLPIEASGVAANHQTPMANITRCGQCQRVRVDGQWRDPQATPVSQGRPLKVIHGVCRQCQEQARLPATE